MRRRISGATILGLVTALLMVALPASAHSFQGEGDCTGWTLHLDGTWQAYDITVDGVSIGLEQNPQIADGSDSTSRTFTVRWWKTGPDVTRTVTVERVLECEQETTTTLPEETTTTTPEETTTTVGVTTTTAPTGSSTTPEVSTTTPVNGTFWFASSECQTLTAEWGEGIAQVDVYWRDPILGEFGPADGLVPFTVSGQTLEAGADAEFILVPVVITGYVAVPDEIHLFTETCTPGDSTTTLSVPELPYTGMSRTGWMTLVFVGAVSAVLGGMLVIGAKDDA